MGQFLPRNMRINSGSMRQSLPSSHIFTIWGLAFSFTRPGLQSVRVLCAHEELLNLETTFADITFQSLVMHLHVDSVLYFNRGIRILTGNFSARIQMVNKWVLFLCTTLSNDPIRTISLNQPPFPALLSQHLLVSIKLYILVCWKCTGNFSMLLSHIPAFLFCLCVLACALDS